MAKTEASASIVSGQTTSTTTAGVSVAGSYANTVGAQIVQAGTATTAAKFKIQASYDGGTTWRDATGEIAAGTAAATYSWGEIVVSPPATHVRAVYTQQAGGTSSTFSAEVGKVPTL